MNIDMLPFSSFALESSGAPALVNGESFTLTLQLAPAALDLEGGAGGCMSGSAGASQTRVQGADLLWAAVVPAEGAALTITF